ncbi:MAG TPA: hypothetical protein VLA09_12730, partial [Longimicrobiales bacterium]|nr:hypothetical protein [Longimicrobiales bacterium]
DGDLPVAPSGPQDCVTCHLPDYQAEHGGSGFPTECLACHSESTWEGADFDHLQATGFELIDSHALLDCVYCHVGSSSAVIFSPSGPQDCFACHQIDYDRRHGGTGFSTNCLDCHQTTTWSGANFSHPFPISSGPHSGEQCSECHTVPDDYRQFTCTTACHHTQSRTDAQHDEVNGYAYQSASCLSCHPTGRRG